LLEQETTGLEDINSNAPEKALCGDSTVATTEQVPCEEAVDQHRDLPQITNESELDRESPLTSVDSEIFADTHASEQLASIVAQKKSNPLGKLSRTSSSASELHIDERKV